MNDDRIDMLLSSPFDKGLPPAWDSMRISTIGNHDLHLLAEDLPMPAAVIRRSALDHNSAWMRAFLKASGATIAPHGKTTMSPQLFRRQTEDGAWGITLSNIHQIKMARHFGVNRILLANQLVGRGGIGFVLDEIARDPDFDFYCLVDGIENVEMLAGAARERRMQRPLQLLVEGGVMDRRTGCRNLDDALAVARAVAAHAPFLALRGIEGFEGVISGPTPAETAQAVTRFVDFLGSIARTCAHEKLFAGSDIVLSAGGSAYFDIVASRFAAIDLGRPKTIVLRSGCYLTHDSAMYATLAGHLLDRSPEARALGAPLRPALEVWTYVQSRPQSNLAIATLGKRDASYDAGLPTALSWCRPGPEALPRPLGKDHVGIEMNDQHFFLRVPENSPLQVGDLVGFGISHPCLTFDKWRIIPVVDDDYRVVSAVTTCF